MSLFAKFRSAIQLGNRMAAPSPQVYTTVVATGGTLAWGAFILGRKAFDALPYEQQDLSAVTGDSPVVQDARFKIYGIDEHLSCQC